MTTATSTTTAPAPTRKMTKAARLTEAARERLRNVTDEDLIAAQPSLKGGVGKDRRERAIEFAHRNG